MRAGAAILLSVGTATLSSAADRSGAEIYSHICQGCHMPGGVGATGAGHYPKLAANPALVSWEYVAITVLAGRHGMPAFGLPADQAFEMRGAHLSDNEVAAVVTYVRGHFGNRYKTAISGAQVAKLPHPGMDAAR